MLDCLIALQGFDYDLRTSRSRAYISADQMWLNVNLCGAPVQVSIPAAKPFEFALTLFPCRLAPPILYVALVPMCHLSYHLFFLDPISRGFRAGILHRCKLWHRSGQSYWCDINSMLVLNAFANSSWFATNWAAFRFRFTAEDVLLVLWAV